jgi:hypothetical protein
MIMIRCPRTGQVVPTGIETDPHSLRELPDTLIYTPCPYCGVDHAWWPDEAWLTDSPTLQEIGLKSRAA